MCPGNPVAGTGEVIRCTAHLRRVCLLAPGHLSFSDQGRAPNTSPTESARLWRTGEPEPEWLRPGKCTQPRALSLQSNLKPEQCRLGKHTRHEQGQTQCGQDTANTHQSYLFAASLPPDGMTEQLSLKKCSPPPPCVRAEIRH